MAVEYLDWDNPNDWDDEQWAQAVGLYIKDRPTLKQQVELLCEAFAEMPDERLAEVIDLMAAGRLAEAGKAVIHGLSEDDYICGSIRDEWDAANPDGDEICIHCNGSGEGMHDGTRCSVCHGSGVSRI